MSERLGYSRLILAAAFLFLGVSGCAVAPSIVTPDLAPAEEGVPYSSTIRVNENAALPLSWDVEGPEAMALSADGRFCKLTWEKPIAGRITVRISVSNSGGADARPFELVVAEAPPEVIPPKIGPVRVPAASVGSVVSVRFLTSAGTPPVAWAKVDGPVSLVVSSDGVLTWLPIAPGEFECCVRASNKVGRDEARLKIGVKATPEYEEAKRIGGLLAQNDPSALPGEAVLFLRENPQSEKYLSYRLGLEAILGNERAKLMHAAASEGADAAFGIGADVGRKLAAEKISDADARNALKQSMLAGEVTLLAWQAGFLKGYSEGGKAVFRALIISLR